MGSLFKVRDYWKATYPTEEFDTKSIVVENIDGDASGDPKIIFGSFQGILRVLFPRQNGQKPHDLLLEHCFKLPILQVVTGVFTTKLNRAQLGILFPKKLVIAAIVTAGQKSKLVEGGEHSEGDAKDEKDEKKDRQKRRKSKGEGEDDNQFNPLDQAYALRIISEFALEHTAYNCVVRPAGSNNTSNLDTIWIQSMDGQLTLFDHNKLSFSCFIPSTEFLIPGHLVHIARKDVIVTTSSTQELNAYYYNTILKSSSSESKERGEGDKMSPDWRFIAGEDVMDLCVARFSKDLPTERVEIVVLCERMLYVLSENGVMKYNKRLDVATISVTPYYINGKSRQNLIISTQENSIMIYSCVALEWSATVHSMALRVAPAKINNIDGMLVMLCDDGSISCNYLGTDPASSPVQLLESKVLDYDEMDEEHKKLQSRIKLAEERQEPNDHMIVRVDPVVHVPNNRCAGTLHLVYDKHEEVSNIVVTINSSEPISPYQSSIVVAKLAAGDTLSMPLEFTMEGTKNMAQEGKGMAAISQNSCDRMLPSSLQVEVIITYEVSGDTLVSKTSFLIPLSFIGTVIPPVKNSTFKVQLDTNKDPPHLADIFGDLYSTCSREEDIASNVISFQFIGRGGCPIEDATILVSKNGGKYRIHASSLESLWLMTSELLRRLRMHFKGCENGGGLVISVPDELPLSEYYEVIDRHFACREELVKAQAHLGKVAHQFRAIQKRLLIRYRDKNATLIASLEMLFEITYRRLYESADEVDKAMAALRVASNSLSCNTHLILLLTRYKYQKTFSRKDLDTFKHFLTPVVTCATTSSGWEETVETAMIELLRTALCKTTKDTVSGGRALELAKDTSSVKRYIGIVMNRIAKGGSVAGAVSEENLSTERTMSTEGDIPSYSLGGRSAINRNYDKNRSNINRSDAPLVGSEGAETNKRIISPHPDVDVCFDSTSSIKDIVHSNGEKVVQASDVEGGQIDA